MTNTKMSQIEQIISLNKVVDSNARVILRSVYDNNTNWFNNCVSEIPSFFNEAKRIALESSVHEHDICRLVGLHHGQRRSDIIELINQLRRYYDIYCGADDPEHFVPKLTDEKVKLFSKALYPPNPDDDF